MRMARPHRSNSQQAEIAFYNKDDEMARTVYI